MIFDLPNQLTYNKEQNVVLTVFDGVVGDRVNVTINMKPENFSDERNSFFIQEVRLTRSYFYYAALFIDQVSNMQK